MRYRMAGYQGLRVREQSLQVPTRGVAIESRYQEGLSSKLRSQFSLVNWLPDYMRVLRVESSERGVAMHIHGKTKLGFFPLPLSEAKRLNNYLTVPSQFSAIDPCVGDGVAFSALVDGTLARRYGVEIDAHRAVQARSFGIEVLQANTMDVRCNAESFSLLYLNPPYDWESGQTGNQRLETVFLEHTYRWLKPEGVLVFVIPQPRLKACARLLADHFKDIRVFRLTEAELKFPK
jgi:Uncharacterised methyltransferase family (DUF6094)